MESLFFQLESRRYRRRDIYRDTRGRIERVDVSSGVLFFRMESRGALKYALTHHDRMALLILAVRGESRLGGEAIGARLREGDALLISPGRETPDFSLASGSSLFVLAVADFHLKRYLSDRPDDPVDFLYRILREERRGRILQRQPLDALSLYLLERILNIPEEGMEGLRAELRVGELLLHHLGFLEPPREGISDEDLELAARARKILAENFVAPPTIPELARRCATNDFRLKKLFKQVYGTSIYSYVRKLRMEEANWLLRQENLSVGDVARRVGYRHRGHFSRIFHLHYGVSPRELTKKSIS
jgi:AraC-like DNA-binding protein